MMAARTQFITLPINSVAPNARTMGMVLKMSNPNDRALVIADRKIALRQLSSEDSDWLAKIP